MPHFDAKRTADPALGGAGFDRRWTGLIFLASLTASVVCVLSADGWVARWAMDLPPEIRRSPFFEGAQALGGAYGSFWLLCVLAWARNRPRLLGAGVLALVVCGLGVLGGKILIGRGRPDRDAFAGPIGSRTVGDYDDLSYPSGDAAQAFALAFVAAAFLPRRWRWAPFAVAAIPALQRVVAARHFLGDVLGGLALGVLCGALALRLEEHIARRWPRRLLPRRARELAALVAVGWCCLWFFAEGDTFAQLYVPFVAMLLVGVKGPVMLRWVGGTGLGASEAGDDAERRLRIARGLAFLLMASMALPPLGSYAPVDEVEAAFIRSLAFGSAFLARLANALGWICSAYFASRIAERFGGPRAALIALLVVGGAFEFAWLARWSGIEMATIAALLLFLEGCCSFPGAGRPHDARRRAAGAVLFIGLLVLRNFLPTSPAEPLPWLAVRPDEFTNPALWSAPLWVVISLLPWPLWLLSRRCRAACLRFAPGDRLLLGAVVCGLPGAMLLGASAEFAASVAAAPLLVAFALRLERARVRGLFGTCAGMLVLATACIPCEDAIDRCRPGLVPQLNGPRTPIAAALVPAEGASQVPVKAVE